MQNEANIFEDKKLELTDSSLGFLKETSKWTKFMAVIGFVGIGLMVLGGVFGASALSQFSSMGRGAAVSPIVYTLMYVVLAALYYLPVRYMWLFATKMDTGIKSRIQSDVDAAFEYLKSHFKYVGIMTIVILSLYVLIIIIAIIAVVAAQMV